MSEEKLCPECGKPLGSNLSCKECLRYLTEEYEIDEDVLTGAVGKVFDEEEKKVDEQFALKLIISMFGNVNSGKSSLINALTGIKYSDVKSVPGWTKEINLYPFPNFPNVIIADIPGLEDINEDVAQRAREFVEQDADIMLFVLNASVGLTKPEKDAFENLRNQGYEIVVVLNKIDTVDEAEREDLINYIKTNLNLDMAIPFCATSAKTEEGIGELTETIAEILHKKGKDLLFAKIARYKDRIVDNWIIGATISAFGIGAIPIPLSDIIPLTALQVGLIIKIARTYGVDLSQEDVKWFISQVAVGKIARTIYRQVLKSIGDALAETVAAPIVAALIAGGIAAGTTYGIGKAAKAYYRSGAKIPLKEAVQIYKESYKTLEKINWKKFKDKENAKKELEKALKSENKEEE